MHVLFEAPLRSRLAPTPSGFLHPGNGLSFIVTWAITRALGGHLLLRIDDLDAERLRPAYLDDIFATIHWLGLDYDEGPQGAADFPAFSQHERLPAYRALLARLRAQGELYACTCSRRDLHARSTDGRYAGTCRSLHLPFEAPHTAWRLALPSPTPVSWRAWPSGRHDLDLAQVMGDPVVFQKNALPAYQLASLADDLHWGINLIVRGADLLPSTAAQVYLAKRLGEGAFAEALFWHHDLLLDEHGQKLSKSKGAGSLKDWRDQGKHPRPLYEMAATQLGLSPDCATSPQALAAGLRQHLGV